MKKIEPALEGEFESKLRPPVLPAHHGSHLSRLHNTAITLS